MRKHEIILTGALLLLVFGFAGCADSGNDSADGTSDLNSVEEQVQKTPTDLAAEGTQRQNVDEGISPEMREPMPESMNENRTNGSGAPQIEGNGSRPNDLPGREGRGGMMSGNESGMPPGDGMGPRGMNNEEMIEACNDKSEGDTCNISGTNEDEIEGTCRVLGEEGTLICAPENMGAPTGGPEGNGPMERQNNPI